MYLFLVSAGCRRMEATALPTVERVVVDHLLVPSSQMVAVWDLRSNSRKPVWRPLMEDVSVVRRKVGGRGQAKYSVRSRGCHTNRRMARCKDMSS